MSRRLTKAAVIAAFALLAGPAVLAQAQAPATPQAPSQPPADAVTDPALKGPQVLAFIGVKPGDKVADIVAGRFVRALSQAVGPSGKVYAVEPDEVVKLRPQVVDLIRGLGAEPAYANVQLITTPINAGALPSGLDAVFIRQNYHDLHDKFMGPANVPAFNKAVFAALKPGGVYVVLDHAAAPGSGLRDTETLHRIDKQAVIDEVSAAGFKLDAESDVLANPADDHTRKVFDPTIRGHTDQFLLRFRKPK
jgi:predicted methyltransferase